MARRQGRTGGRAEEGKDVKVSVTIGADTHARLRCLALLRQTTGTELVAALIKQAVERVRLPSLGYDAEGSAEDAA
jgi:hypothetical protein